MGTCETAWLWQNERWADFSVSVFDTDAGQDTEPLYTLKVASLVLAAASPGHFRGHSERLKEQQDEDTGRQAKKRRLDVSTGGETGAGAGEKYRCILFPGEPEAVPRATLQHLYLGTLPDDPEQLIWMLWRADYWDLAATVSAVLTKLETAAKYQLALQHAALLSALPALQCQARSDSKVDGTAGTSATQAPTPAPAARVQALVDILLRQHLSSAPTIAASAALLAQFSELPLALVARWVQLDKYKADFGNTLAVLFTAWHDAQPEPPSEEQCQQLSALLPLAAVSLMFRTQVLPHLRWWREPKDALAADNHAETRGGADAPAQQRAQAGGAGAAGRATESSKVITLNVPAREFETLWQNKRHRIAQIEYTGYSVSVTLTLTPSPTGTNGAQTSGRTMRLGVEVSIGWHDALVKSVGSTQLPAPKERLQGLVTVVHKGEHCYKTLHAGQWPLQCSGPLTTINGVVRTFASREELAKGAVVTVELSR